MRPLPVEGARAGECESQADGGYAEDRDRRVEDFEADFQALSHSLRSPLVALRGFTDLLSEEARERLGENGSHFLRRIDEAGRRIEWRLNDVGELLAIDDAPLACGWVDPRPLIEGLRSELKRSLESQGGRLRAPADMPPIWCDQSLLRTALLHLIGNALQHAVTDSHPDIEVRVRRDETATEISVIDEGPGMDASLRARAFELFACAGERRRVFEPKRESTGLGLALVRRIALAHGGSARIEGEPGRGLQVVLSFPHAH